MNDAAANVELGIFSSRVNAVCEEMGAVLRRAALSPNIRDRLDFSCALFDADGALIAQATHIPVHLGSMAYAMTDLAGAFDWREGDLVILNDPFRGGTHLPDVTLIAPARDNGELAGFAACRAHYSDIGSSTPGSMPVSRSLEEEGVLISPVHVYRRGSYQPEALAPLFAAVGDPEQVGADLEAQVSACRVGVAGLLKLRQGNEGNGGDSTFNRRLERLQTYAQTLAARFVAELPDGSYRFADHLDGDGAGARDLSIEAEVTVSGSSLAVDFSGTCEQVEGNVNCPLSVTAAAVYYVLRCLLPPHTPACAGSMRPLTLTAPPGCLVNARPPAAVAAGNVETSMRIVDVLCGALAPLLPERIPAASQGSMNNIAMGGHWNGRAWSYYETLAGGCGGSASGPGASALHSHMTNTLNTPVEVVESHYPLRVREYSLRRGSGGSGCHAGGDGVCREYLFLESARVSLITERRQRGPWGLAGGQPGAAGRNRVSGEPVGDKVTLEVSPGDRLRLETPGGGGWGEPGTPAGA